jgi:hypothetical protein
MPARGKFSDRIDFARRTGDAVRNYPRRRAWLEQVSSVERFSEFVRDARFRSNFG